MGLLQYMSINKQRTEAILIRLIMPSSDKQLNNKDNGNV
jgi:hypothetical protein